MEACGTGWPPSSVFNDRAGHDRHKSERSPLTAKGLLMEVQFFPGFARSFGDSITADTL